MQDAPRTYRISQLGRPDARQVQLNEDVDSLEGLVTHHPGANRRIRMEDGVIQGAENPHRRSHAFIGGDFEEIIDSRVDKYGSLDRDQVLLVKDFILEDPSPARGKSARSVGVPSPVDGYISRISAAAGMVEISDHADGRVLARVRHMSDLRVQVGQSVAYGQTLGVQDNLGLGLRSGQAVHVHMEVDTRLYREYANYLADLASGRLPVQDALRNGVRPQVALDDGTFRLGESHPRIAGLQRVMHGEGYRAADGGPLDRDGVYRPSMQGALLDFQRAHGIPQTGDIDPATLRFAPGPRRRDRDLADRFEPGRPMPREAGPATAPGHPDHPDHRGLLPPEADPPVNRKGTVPATGGMLDRVLPALEQRDPDAITRALSDLARSDGMQAWLERGRMALDLQQPPAADSAHARTPEPLFRG